MSWLIFKLGGPTGRELVMPRQPENRSVRIVDHDPRHHGESLVEVVRDLRPGAGYEYVCYEVDDRVIDVAATRPPTPPMEIHVVRGGDA